MYTTEGQSPPKTTKSGGKNNDQLRIGKGKSNGRDDWNEREAIKSATILWYDTEDEGYELEIENEDDLDAEDFRAWVEENADSLAQEDAAANGTTFEGIEEIEYETEWIDDDALFEAEYADACESECEWMTGRGAGRPTGAVQRPPVAGMQEGTHTYAPALQAPHSAAVRVCGQGIICTISAKISLF